jgi:hypothetical protein
VTTLLSNDVTVSGPGEGNGRGDAPPDGGSVLANLPRTRPQRASARRAAARSAAAATEESAAANGNGSAGRTTRRKAAPKAASKTASAPRTGPRKKPTQKAARTGRRRDTEAVPRQGFESVEERATGPVAPPGGAELVGTAAEIVSELAKAGISGGERVLRDVLSRLGR